MKHNILMPDLGQTTSEGKLLRWFKKPGDLVRKGESLIEVETDKVTMEVEAYRSGYLRKLLVQEGAMVTAMSPIAILTDDPREDFESSSVEAGASASTTAPVESFTRAAPLPVAGESAVAPGARILARELGIDLTKIQGTGPGGLITRKDVERHAGS